MGIELLIVLHELSACFLVERTLREGHDKEALDNLEDVGKGPPSLAPVLFKGVDTYLPSLGGYVRMENLGQEVPFRRLGGKVRLELKLALEDSSFICSSHYTYS